MLLYGFFIFLLTVRPVYAGDNERWTLFKSMNSVNDIECVDGVLWCATDGGVLAWDTVTGSRHVYTEMDGLRRTPVDDILVSRDDIWCRDMYGLYKYHDNEWEYLSFCENCYTFSTIPAVDRNGLLWAVINNSVHCHRDNAWVFIETPTDIGRCRAVAFDADNRLWWLSTDYHIYVRDEDGWTAVDTEDISATKMVSDNAEGMWIISSDKLYHVPGSSWDKWDYRDSFIDIAVAPDGVPCVSTGSYFYRVENDVIIRFQPEAYGPLDSPRICYDADGTLWFGQNAYAGIGQYDGETWSMYTIEGPSSNYVIDCTQTPSGDIYFATSQGLSVWKGHTWSTIDTGDGLASDNIHDVETGSDGSIWILAGNTLQHRENNRWMIDAVVDLRDDLLRNSGIACGNEGTCWLGTRHGLFHWDGLDLERIDYEPGTPLVCGPLAVDQDNRLWLAQGGVVSVFDGTDWTTYSEAEGLPGTSIHSLVVDDSNRIWCSGSSSMMFDGVQWHEYSPINTIAQSVMVGTNIINNPSGGIMASGFCTLKTDEWVMYTFDGSSYTVIDDYPFEMMMAMDALLMDSDGSCWYGGNGYGIVRFRPGASTANGSLSTTSPVTIRGNYPNPFNSGTAIEYELSRDGRVVVDVYNSLGQLVTSVLDRSQLAGSHRVRWHGRSSSGPVSSGVYFARITTRGHSAVQPMTLVR